VNLLLVTGIFPPDIGGPATYVPTLARELVNRGHEVAVVTLSDALTRDDRTYPFRVVRLQRGLTQPLRFLVTVWTLVRQGRQADLLFVNGLYPEALVANFFLRRPLVQKIVGDWAWEWTTNEGWITENFEEFQKNKYGLQVEALKTLRNLCVRYADKSIVPSRYLARWVAAWGVPEEKLVVIYNAVELPNGVPPAEVPLSTPLKIVTVGRLVLWKHVDKLIRALARLEGAGLVIVGDGPERPALQKLAGEAGVADRMYFAGQRSKTETFALMTACDLFVLNSTYEGLPHVALEAMSCGLPVVATAVGGTPEVVEDGRNGRLVPPLGDGALHEALSQLLSTPSERQRLADGARQTVERFHLARLVAETEVVLERVAYPGIATGKRN
jgi:glycosyltransferase involved in cell wall biosynthesis